MLKITYNMHSHQKWAFGETEDTDERTFYGQDEFDIRRQIDDVLNSWYQDPAVQSIRFEEISREELEEEE